MPVQAERRAAAEAMDYAVPALQEYLTCGSRALFPQQILAIRNRRHGADSGFAVCSSQCHISRSVVGGAILIPAVRRT